MAFENLFRSAQVLGWVPDADSVNAPPGTLLRADNLITDEKGALSVRKGSQLLYSSLVDQDVHTLKTLDITGFADTTAGTYRLMGVDSHLYLDGIDSGEIFGGSGDFAIGTDAYQAFIARGASKKKFDGSNMFNWGIQPPDKAPTLAAVNALTAEAASFDSTESPALVISEGTAAFVAGYNGTANGALEIVPNTAARATVYKTYSSATDFFTISGAVGSDTDLFDIFIRLSEPTAAEKVTVVFGATNTAGGADPFAIDAYSFEFDIGRDISPKIKDTSTYSSASYNAYVTKIQAVLAPEDVTNVATPDQVSEVVKKVASVGPTAQTTKDAATWAHLSVTRGQFSRLGGTAGRDWTTITGFKVIYQAVPGSTATVRFDSAVFYGGGDRALTGTFRVGYRFVRNTGAYQEVSPLSPVSDDIILSQQGLQVTIPAMSLQGADPQVNEIWLYIFGGFLDTYYRFAVCGSNVGFAGMTINEFAPAADGTIDAADRTRFTSWGLTIPGFTPDNGDLVVTALRSEVDILTENKALEPGSILPPDNVIAIEGPLASRMFALTADGWLYISGQRTPSSFSAYWTLDLRQWGSPLWMQRTIGGIYIGMTRDVIFVSGTGDESADHIRIDFTAVPQHSANPPVDQAVLADQNTIIYRAADGLIAMTGPNFEPVSQGTTTLLWRGYTRHGVPPLNITTGRFRLAIDNHILYMLAPEGDSDESTSTIWRYYEQKWTRLTYTQAHFRSIHREPNGNLIAGGLFGSVWLLEDGNQDNGVDIPIYLVTPIEDGGLPLNRKDPFDLQIHANTAGQSGTVNIFLFGVDATTSAPHFSTTFTTPRPLVYRINISRLNRFLKAQISITGSFHTFNLHAFNLTYRKRPQQMMVVDTGAILPAEPSRYQWIRQVEVDCWSPVNLELLIYMNDVLIHRASVPVVAFQRDAYRISLPRGIVGTRPRLLLQTTNSNGIENVGFELYSIRVKAASSGNESDKGFVTVWPGEQLS